MLRLTFVFLLSFVLVPKLIAQNDSLICKENCVLKEGVYVSWLDFRMRHSIEKDQIVSDFDKAAIDFYTKALSEDKLIFTVSGTKNELETKNIWGFCQNNVLHLNIGGNFFRVPVFGSISYLIASVEVISPSYYTPGYGMYGSSKTTEIRNFLMNFYDGKVQEFSMDQSELLLSRDKELFAEYKLLKRKKQKEQISRFIRKFNERNPVYFLK